MREPLSILSLQLDLVWEDIPANLKKVQDELDKSSKDVDLIVLPEMFSTGFTMNAEGMAESMDGQAVQAMLKWSSQTGAAVTGSLIIEEEGRYYNRLIWAEPDGSLKSYDKRHLFTLAEEQKYFTPGSERLFVEWKGWRILPLICYDLRFPVWSRNADMYDLVLFVANWPERRSFAWNQLLIARAIENQSYVVGVNRVGHDGNKVNFKGNSVVIDPMGETVASMPEDKEGAFKAEISGKYLKEIRQKLAFLNDRDEFMII